MSRKYNRVTAWFSHIFHLENNVQPLVWIALYIGLVPVFAFIYWLLPDGQFRYPDGAGTGYGSWLYYSIVTISTLGFGDYTPAHGVAQAVTAVEVISGLVILGFFLNAVGAMKSEIDVESEIEKQRILHEAQEQQKLVKSTPLLLHLLQAFVNICKGRTANENYTADFVHSVDSSAKRASLALDTFQNRTDLSIWPDLLEDSFAFVANYQIMETDMATQSPKGAELDSMLNDFISRNVELAKNIELLLTRVAVKEDQES